MRLRQTTLYINLQENELYKNRTSDLVYLIEKSLGQKISTNTYLMDFNYL